MAEKKKRRPWAKKAKGTECEIRGHETLAYPLRLSTMLNLKPIFEPLAQAVTLLFANRKADRSYREEEIKDADGATGFKIEQEAVDVEIMRARTHQTSQAIKQLFDALAADDNRDQLAQIVKDTLRDSYSDEDTEEVLDELDLADLADILRAAWAANRTSFGPLADRVDQALAGEAPPQEKENKPAEESPTAG